MFCHADKPAFCGMDATIEHPGTDSLRAGGLLVKYLNPKRKKAFPLGKAFLLDNGGADGTRTRDPRRDRPVF